MMRAYGGGRLREPGSRILGSFAASRTRAACTDKWRPKPVQGRPLSELSTEQNGQ